MKKLEKAEIVKKSVTELNDELLALKEELFKLRFAHATNQLENPQKLVNVRRDIARVKTILREREIRGITE